MSASRSDHLALGYSSHSASQNRSNSPSATNSPIDPLSTTTRSVFGLAGGMNSSSIIASNTRSGAGSPSHEMAASSRLFSKRFVAHQKLRLSNPPPPLKSRESNQESLASSKTHGVSSQLVSNPRLTNSSSRLGLARSRLRKAFLVCLSTLGADRPRVGIRRLSEKISPSHPPTAFQTLSSCRRRKACLPPDALELVPCPLAFPEALATAFSLCLECLPNPLALRPLRVPSTSRRLLASSSLRTTATRAPLLCFLGCGRGQCRSAVPLPTCLLPPRLLARPSLAAGTPPAWAASEALPLPASPALAPTDRARLLSLNFPGRAAESPTCI